MKSDLLSIIVIAHNEESHIAQCLDAVIVQSAAVAFKTEIIVVDNASTDRTEAIVRALPVQYFYEKELGPSQARNRGWRESKGDLLLFVDGDCVIQEALLEKVFRCFDDPVVDACACNFIHDSDSKAIVKFMNEHVQRAINFTYKDYRRLFLTINGACMGLRKHVIDELGGFSEKYPAGEDSEISWRLIYENKQISFLNDVHVRHLTHDSVMGIFRSQCSRLIYTRYLKRVWTGVFILFNASAGISFLSLCVFLKRSLDSKGLPSLRDRFSFFLLMIGHLLKWQLDSMASFYFDRSFFCKERKAIPAAHIDKKSFFFNDKRFSLRPDVKFKFRKNRVIFYRSNTKQLFCVDGIGKDFLKCFFLSMDCKTTLELLCANYDVDQSVLLQDLERLLEDLRENRILDARGLE